MPGKVPQPWYRESVGAWYVCIQGKQHRLGTDKAQALRAYHLLMAGQVTPTAAEPEWACEGSQQADRALERSVTVKEMVARYLADAQRRQKPNTYRVVRDFVSSFAALFGGLPADGVRKHHAETWVGKHPTWGPTTEWDAKTRLVTMFNWAVAQELLPANHLRGIHKPPVKSRGASAVVPPDDHAKLIREIPAFIRNVLIALHQTGARPSEVLSVTAADFYPDQGVWILERHKTAHKTGQPRIIYLTPELVSLCQELAAKYPTGPLFRQQNGRAWYDSNYLAQRVRYWRKKLGIRGVTPYGYRHTFATDALTNGVPEAHVAELFGHSGTAMLHKHYAHLGTKAQALRSALDRVR